MAEFVSWMQVFIFSYPALKYFIVFLGSAFGGELAMITLGFLAAQGIFPLYPLFIVSFFGTMSSDILYFLMGRTNIADKFFSHRYATPAVEMITVAVRQISRGSHFIALFLANFMLASRIILIVYVSKTDLSFKRFLYYESISVILWLLAVITIGFLSGIGYTYISGILENIYAGIGFVLLVFILVIILQLWLKRIFTKEGEEILEHKDM